MNDDSSSQDSLVIERTVDAPAELVWRMWTDPEQFAAWYGPAGASIPVAQMDVRVGGARFVGMEMSGPDGTMRMWFTGEFREVVENRRLVYTEAMCDEQGNVLPPSAMGMPEGHPTTTEVVVELEELDGRTAMTLTHVGVAEDSPGAAGWRMALDQLAAHAGGLQGR